MRIYVKWGGQYVGLAPNTEQPYHDRDTPGEWEAIELTAHPNGQFDALFIKAQRQLSLTPGGLESRPLGAIGSWELPYATEQPDGSKLLYRTEGGRILGPVFQIEEA